MTTNKKQVYFYRNYEGLTGGHLKVWHYFSHLAQTGDFEPWVYFTENSLLDADQPWKDCSARVLPGWNPLDADLLFLGGLDWNSLPERQRHHFPKPIINLVQNTKHAIPETPLYSFLSHRAVRICVSQEVQHAIEETGKVNGPVFTINNGLDINLIKSISNFTHPRKYTVCIAGLKNPDVALQLFEMLQNNRIQTICLTQNLARRQFLEVLGQSDIAVVLPMQQEGYFLPFWEAAAAGCLPVCPIHDGATSQWKDGVNGFFPSYTAKDLFQSVQAGLRLSAENAIHMKFQAQALCKDRTLLREKEQFLEIVKNVQELY